MRIGITGSEGVLGRLLTEELLHLPAEIVPFKGDIRDAGSVDAWAVGMDLIVHAAAMVPVPIVESKPAEAVAVNVLGTAHVAQAAARRGNCTFVYLSTSHVYAPKSNPIAETDPIRPQTLYGLTKLHGEDWVRALVPNHLIIRIFSFFDRFQRSPFLIPSLRERIMNAPPGAAIELQGGDSQRDIADAQWVSKVCALLIRNRGQGIFNCSPGVGRKISEIAAVLASALGRADIRWQIKNPRPFDILIADVRKLKTFLGELPHFDLQDAFARYVAPAS